MHHLNAVAEVFETSRGNLKLHNGPAGSCIQGPTLDDAGQKSASGKLPVDLLEARFWITSELPTRTKPLARRTLPRG